MYISELDQKNEKREIKQKINKSYTQLKQKNKNKTKKIYRGTHLLTDLSGDSCWLLCCGVAARENGILFVEFVKVLRRLLTEKEEEEG